MAAGVTPLSPPPMEAGPPITLTPTRKTSMSISSSSIPLLNTNLTLTKMSTISKLEEGEIPPSPVSFAAIVKGHSGVPAIESLPVVTDIPHKPISQYQGKPAVSFHNSDISKLLAEIKLVLIGKFTHGRPSIQAIKEFFRKLKLRGDINISNFDKKHSIVECSCKADFVRLWLKLVWSIQGFSMRIFKWEKQFAPSKESPTAPVWIRLEGLPLYLFEGNTICSIANAAGTPLRIDPRTLNRTILSYASICVEMDVTKPCIDSIWISIVDEVSKANTDGFWIKVMYDFIPQYCQACFHIGHGMDICKLATADQVLDNLPNSNSLFEVASMGKAPVQDFEKPPLAPQIAPVKIVDLHHSGPNNVRPGHLDSDGFVSIPVRAVKAQQQPENSKDIAVITGNSFSSLDLQEDVGLEPRDALTATVGSDQKHKQTEEVKAGNEAKELSKKSAKLSTTELASCSETTEPPSTKDKVCSGLSKAKGIAVIDKQARGKQKTMTGAGDSSIISSTKKQQDFQKVEGVNKKSGDDRKESNIASTSKSQKNASTPGRENTHTWADRMEAGEPFDMFVQQFEVEKNEPKPRGHANFKDRVAQKDHNEGVPLKNKQKFPTQIDIKRLICQDDSLNKSIDYPDYEAAGFRLIARRSLSRQEGHHQN